MRRLMFMSYTTNGHSSISEVLRDISTDGRETFFAAWMKTMMENDTICYDITSISSYAASNEYIKYGYNRDKESLPQLNLAMLFGQVTELPVYFQRMPGNISDVSTLSRLIKTTSSLQMPECNYVLDKGFYSKKNVDELLAARTKFTLSVPISNKWVQKICDEVREEIQGPEGYRKVDGEILYVHSRLYPWGDERRRCYVHLYYNAHARAEALDRFNEDLVTYKEELESGKPVAAHQEAYDKFFTLKTTPKRGLKVSFNMAAIGKHIHQYKGFMVLLSNAIKDPVKALQVYRDKDIVEKCFDDLKNQLDMKRLRMHSARAVDGRLFVQFIALIYISALRREMRKSDLIEKYTVRELLEEMETLTKITYRGKHGHILTELTKPARHILKNLGILAPQ